MTDLLLTAMVPTAMGVTYNTRDGTPYRGDPGSGTCSALPQHVAELQTYGFTIATAAQIPAGDNLQQDVGWAVTV